MAFDNKPELLTGSFRDNIHLELTDQRREKLIALGYEIYASQDGNKYCQEECDGKQHCQEEVCGTCGETQGYVFKNEDDRYLTCVCCGDSWGRKERGS